MKEGVGFVRRIKKVETTLNLIPDPKKAEGGKKNSIFARGNSMKNFHFARVEKNLKITYEATQFRTG